MNGLTKLGTVLTVVFLVSLLALVVELLYVLWRRQNFRRRSGPELSGDAFYNMTPSKEQLLYFFCLKNQSRIEPAGNPDIPPPQRAEAVVVVDDEDVAKWQHEMHGLSRVLFTIREEEREGTETSEAENDQAVKSKPARFEAESESESESLSGCVVRIEAVDCEEATPFSTPCASPPYYTPSPSPTHDKSSLQNGEVVISKGQNAGSFFSLKVCTE